MKFVYGRCSDCEFLVPLQRDGTCANHLRRFNTHAHQAVTQRCLGWGFAPLGAPVVIHAGSARRARQLARSGMVGARSAP